MFKFLGTFFRTMDKLVRTGEVFVDSMQVKAYKQVDKDLAETDLDADKIKEIKSRLNALNDVM